MAITFIQRITGSTNNLVYIETTDTTAAALAAGYITAQTPNITALNEGVWTWETNDCIMLSASDGISWCSITPNFSTLIEFASSALSQQTLATLGIHTSLFTNAGGSATTTITDTAITAASVVIARWQSSANPVHVLTVLPAAGSLTVVSSADPGASVLEYISYTPSTRLSSAGVIVGKASYAGGAATFTVPAPGVTAAMTINANFQSEANAAGVYTVIAGAGTITVVANTNPGVSVVEYSAFVPNATLTGVGLYGADYANAGGSATITITDANITTSSIVTADFNSQANVSYIEKVTPTAGTLTILASADPGVSVIDYIATSNVVGGPFLRAANNLSDVNSASTSLANLGGLALAGGQMTGSILLDRGTATSTAGAATVNHQAGVITTEILSTAAASAYAFTLTNSRITTASIVLLQLMGGTNTTRGLELRAIPGNGSATLSIYNNNVAGTGLNGTLIFGFVVI